MYWVGSVGAGRRNVHGRWVVLVVEGIIVELIALLEGVARRGRAVCARVHGSLMVAAGLFVVCIMGLLD